MSELPQYVRQIVASVADHHGVTVAQIMGPRQHRLIARARQHAYAALRDRGASYPQIGMWLARDHSTVLYGDRAHRARLAA